MEGGLGDKDLTPGLVNGGGAGDAGDGGGGSGSAGASTIGGASAENTIDRKKASVYVKQGKTQKGTR